MECVRTATRLNEIICSSYTNYRPSPTGNDRGWLQSWNEEKIRLRGVTVHCPSGYRGMMMFMSEVNLLLYLLDGSSGRCYCVYYYSSGWF